MAGQWQTGAIRLGVEWLAVGQAFLRMSDKLEDGDVASVESDYSSGVRTINVRTRPW